MGVGQHVPGLLSHAPANFVCRAWIDQTFPAPPVQSPSTLLPFLGHSLQPTTKPPAVHLNAAAAHLRTETPLSLAGWPGHTEPSPWVCECLAWYVRPGNGRHRKWARRGGVEKSRARVTQGAARTETNPLFTHPRFELRGLRVNFW